MSRIRAADPAARLRVFHAAAAAVWALLIIPTVLWLPNSILWVAFMSVYAIVIAHWSAYQASRAETRPGGDRKDQP